VFAQSTSLKATDCTFLGNSSGAGGGGLYSFSQDAAQVTGCRFQENSSTAGGALYLEESYAEVVDCTFTGNTAANGGALYMSAWSSPVARGCIFLDNAASPNSGGAIDCWHSLPLLEDCEFVGNTAVLDGGALAANGVCQPSLERCRFIDNAAGRNGGAMSGYYATGADLVECTLTGNGAVGQGGGIFYRLGGPLTLDRTIVAFSPDGEALACSESNSITVSCSDVYANAGGDWVACLAGLGGVPGNFSADPLFCDAAAADVALLPDSPCLPANSPCAAQVGAEGPGCGSAVGAGSTMETSSWGRIKARYRGR